MVYFIAQKLGKLSDSFALVYLYHHRYFLIEIDLRDRFCERQYAHINLFLDAKALFQLLDKTDSNEEIVFTIKVGDVLKNEVQFFVKTKSEEIEMTNIQKEIKIYDK